MTKPNRDLVEAAMRLEGMVAHNLTAALEHLHRELSVLDGFPEKGDAVAVRASSELTSVERHADARYQLTAAREELRDLKARVLLAIRDLNEGCNHVLRMRTPRVVVKPDDQKRNLCCSGQAGKHGVEVWGDALCAMPAVKAGLCQKHYQRWRRARIRDGIDTSRDFEPA